MLDSIQGYNQLYSYILDVQCNPATSVGLSNCFGTASSITNIRKGGLIAPSSRATVCMPLLGCIGTGSDKMISVGLLSDDIRL